MITAKLITVIFSISNLCLIKSMTSLLIFIVGRLYIYIYIQTERDREKKREEKGRKEGRERERE